ncbi:glycosyltransferase family 8 protein [Trametes coccinea BRFM310]|uniref:Glycosyltransferase family 8 protein n=1 Tax=Trametes coccinea (strain BRFM310) TaxID=1353009 RepID=A0A1Y2IR92_TRAC3|nr:glycosyltransferase family 8 protein [Trametes coccinea BRFM310]
MASASTSSTSYFPPYQDSSPILPDPPHSPWRSRTHLFRRRPLHFRQVAFIVASITFTFSLFAFYHYRDSSYQYDLDGVSPPAVDSESLSYRPTFDNVHAHRPPAHHVPPALANTVAAAEPEPSPQPEPVPHDALSPAAPPPLALEPIVFSLIMFYENSAAEGAILIKSLILYSSHPLEFHIICDQSAQEYLERRIALIKHPQHDVLIRFYRIPFDRMEARIQREGAISTDHSAGVPGLMKLFIHEILPPSVKRAIFVDTDAFFISDPAQLWARFAALQPGTAISMPYHPDQSEPEWHDANKICSCIMLLDLQHLRDLRLMDSSYYRADPEAARVPPLGPSAFEAMFGKPIPADAEAGTVKYDGVKLGDQGYWWAIVKHRPDLFEHLSFDWEVSSCLMDMYLKGLGEDDADEAHEAWDQVHTHATPEQGRAVLPKMVHFNCLDGVDRYYDWSGWSDPENGLAQRWLPAVRYHVGYKWLWLNTPASNASLTMETLFDVKFADEIFAEERASAAPAVDENDDI